MFNKTNFLTLVFQEEMESIKYNSKYVTWYYGTNLSSLDQSSFTAAFPSDTKIRDDVLKKVKVSSALDLLI